jgi:arylsulfatase B
LTVYLFRSSSYARTPEYRGFDKFYGFYSPFIHYDTKANPEGVFDLQNGLHLEMDPALVDSGHHSAFILANKANDIILEHASNYGTTQPFFFYYAVQLIHAPYLAPDIYTSRCVASADYDGGSQTLYIQYCGLNLMLDEAVANISCTLSSTGLLDNTVIILASDNGANHVLAGATLTPGGSYPYRGYKWGQYRGGVSVNAFIFSPLLDASVKGTSYFGQMHVTGNDSIENI